MYNSKVTHSELLDKLDYNPDTGEFIWKNPTNQSLIGKVAGCKAGGYTVITIGSIRYYSHRLAWLYVYKEWPKQMIDHINRNKSDNRISNLREANYVVNAQNQKKPKNNTSGHKGVSWVRKDLRWVVSIQVNKKYVYLGYFIDLEQAIKARKDAEVKYGFSNT